MRATHMPVILQQTYPRNGPSRYQEWFSKQQLRNKSLEITSLPAGMREFVCSDVATITGISEIKVEDYFCKDPIFYIEVKTELATENETRIHKDDEEELLAFQKDIYDAVLGPVIEEKEMPKEVLKGTETILLVDDEDMIIDVGREILKALGYKVLVARSGKEGIEICKKNKDKIDLVILDMIMPEIDGGEAYDRMKKIKPDIKVLLSSGYSIDGQATEILKRGCNGFIQKPFNIKKLSRELRKILDS